MNQPMIVRVLQVVAVGLGIAIVVLGAASLRQDRVPPGVHRSVEASESREVGEVARLRAAAVPAADAPALEPRQDALPAPDAPAAAAVAEHAVLYGSIRDAEGGLVEQGVMWAYRGRDSKHVGTCSLPDGSFAFAGLEPGAHRLKTRIDDQLPLDREVEVTAPHTRIDLTLAPRWRLVVHAVTPDGSPVLEALAARNARGGWHRGFGFSAYATRQPLTEDLPPSNHATVEGGLGVFRGNDIFRDQVLPKSAIGVLALPPTKAVSVALMLRNVVVAQMPAMPDQTDLTFALTTDDVLAKTATVRMRLVDAQGAAVAGARVSMSDAQSSSSGARTGEDGRIVLEHLRPGRLGLSIRHVTRHATLKAPPVLIDVPGGAKLDLGDVTLRTMVSVPFSLEDFGGDGGIRGYWLDAPPDPDWHVDDFYFGASNGRLLTYGLFPGRYFLLAQSGDRVAHMTLDTSAVGAEPVRFQFDHGVPLRVRGDVGGLPSRLTIKTSGGGLVHWSEISGTIDRRLVLPAGDYVAEITGGDSPIRRTIALRSGGAELKLP